MDKALIKTNWYGNIVMHDLIRGMAEQIVHEECEGCIKTPETRSRLKDANEIRDVLESDIGAGKVEGIMLDLKQIKPLQLRADVFTKMNKLRILKVFGSSTTWSNTSTYMELPDGLDYLPDKLRYFRWDHYPLESLPLGFCPKNLVELRMPNSNAKKLWDGDGVLDLGNLKIIDLSQSTKLVELPDLSKSHKLKIVNLYCCTSLRSVHPSILSLHSIVELDVSHCYELESLESETHLESLSTVKTWWSPMLKKFCVSSNKLREICLCGNHVEILHLPIGRCTELRELALDCDRLRSLPIHELCGLTNLEVFKVNDFKKVIHTRELHYLFDAWRNLRELYLDGCSNLSEIPNNIKGLTRLESLSFRGSSVETLPACINHLSSLKYIYLRSCKSLKSILGLPPFLEELDATDCTLLETVSSDPLPRHRCDLDFRNCVKLDERFMEKLTRSTMTSYEDDYHRVIYAGSRVPAWMRYKPMPQPSNAIQFTYNAKPSHEILFCCVAPRHFFSEVSVDVWCKFSIDGNKWCSEYDEGEGVNFKMDSDHVFLWPTKMDKNEARTGNPAKFSCKFFLTFPGDEEGDTYKVPVEACGVHVIYFSESEVELDLEEHRKRKRDADEEGVPPTKQLKNNSPVGLELELGFGTTKSKKSHDDFICHPLQHKFLQKDLSLIHFL